MTEKKNIYAFGAFYILFVSLFFVLSKCVNAIVIKLVIDHCSGCAPKTLQSLET